MLILVFTVKLQLLNASDVFVVVTKAIGDPITPFHVSSVAAFIVHKLNRYFRLGKGYVFEF